ncbi:hypothetical protein ACSBR2_019404 [Camellia fascicularis]
MGSCAFFTLFSLVLKKAFVKGFEPRPYHDDEVDLKGKSFLVASSVDARTDQGEYCQVIMKDQPMPEAIEGLIIHQGLVSSPLSDKKTNCHTTTEAAANNNQLVNDSAEKKAFVKDFEPRPYHDNEVDLKGKSFLMLLAKKQVSERTLLATVEFLAELMLLAKKQVAERTLLADLGFPCRVDVARQERRRLL